MKRKPPEKISDLLQLIQQDYAGLSRQLKVIARYIERHRNQIGLVSIRDLANNCSVQPSAIIRFAKLFGFSGYSEMQRLFLQGLFERIALEDDYQNRIQRLIAKDHENRSTYSIMQEYIREAHVGLERLYHELDESVFNEALQALLNARSIWVVGFRRSFPVAAYLNYALQHTEKHIHWLDGAGAMQLRQINTIGPDDALIAISFEPYAQETVHVVQKAVIAGANVVALTDSRLSPIASGSSLLLVHEVATFGFRSLTGALTLAQGLFIALAYQLELAYKP